MEEQLLTSQDIEKMIRHWLSTPIDTYLGSDYGFDKSILLFTPLTMNRADELIAKIKRDIPALSVFPINLYSVPIPPDKVQIFIQIGDLTVEI